MVDAYTKNGSVLRFTRRGKKSNNGRYVVVDDLSMTYDGNKLVKVEDSAQLVTTTGSFDFTDGCDEEEYLYDGCGALVADKNKGISNIMYDNLGYPKEIQFSNGNKTRYVYLPDGTKLKTTHITAVDGIVVPLSNTVELADYQIINRDSTEYFGDIIYENGIVRRYIYDGGYVSVAYYSPSDVSYLSYHHYVKDHIGNIRAVVSDNGHVEQTTHYYPSGAIMSDISTNQSLQPNKYNGKELDRMHGLDWYDYGARNYDAQILTWDRMDPLCEKYYGISPYVYCANNPVRFVDMDGKEPIKMYAGTVSDFARLLNNSPRHVGKYRGQVAANYVKSLSDTEWNLSQFRPIPTQTPYFNKKKGRYIYTTKGGWLDKSHFMFYAGRAYNYKVQKEQAIKALSGPNYACLPEVRHSLEQQANMNPVSEAVQDGYHQELSDFFVAKQSAYSYEDLPSDKLGAFLVQMSLTPIVN